jgi:hypothetical protein
MRISKLPRHVNKKYQHVLKQHDYSGSGLLILLITTVVAGARDIAKMTII